MNHGKQIVVLSTLLVVATAPSFAGVTIKSPLQQSEVVSPFALSAASYHCSAESVVSMSYSLDSSPNSVVVKGKSLDTAILSPPGTHTLHVKATGEKGSVCVADVTVIVKLDAANGQDIPPNATTVSNIQALSNWISLHDTGGKGQASGSTSLAHSPSLSGESRQFISHYAGGGDERFSVDYADDKTASNFFYDTWVYIPSSSSPVANIEMDTNQVLEGGLTIVLGVQCDGYSHTWAYTANLGTAAQPHPHWEHAKGTSCDPGAISRDAWHHFQASYSHDLSGNVTYNSTWLDGVQTPLNLTVFGGFDLGWKAGKINTQFQVDGKGSSGTDIVYADSLTISRW